MPKMTDAMKSAAKEIDRQHKELYKNTEKYLKDRHAAGQSHNPEWKGPKEHEQSYWSKK